MLFTRLISIGLLVALSAAAQRVVRIPGVGGSGSGGGGGGGSISLVQDRGDSGHGACNSGGSGVTSLTCTFSSAPTHGNAVIVFCYIDSSLANTPCTVSDNAGTDTYTQVALTLQASSSGSILNNCIQSGNKQTLCIWYSLNVMGSATIKGVPAANSFTMLHLYEISGALTSAALDQEIANDKDTSQASASATTSATSQANEFVIMGCAEIDNTTPSAGTGWTLAMSDANPGTLGIGGAEVYSLSNSAAAQTPTINYSPNVASGFACGVATFKHS